ncbi:nucleotidyltransferase family protein [Streptomyces sp. HNM0574]|uniref:nucleotidyltransferase family protein n=1 Tax=Streptomyces sp. HNM0574 TaxID=2714954 RepID=UPI00146B3B41|nr:nucleotidyltransferase family protein [Streptomyces sp. HNM0574]NLU65965.1 nucleotidyltransferase family protein [Streptomyces sp. HNM0574]
MTHQDQQRTAAGQSAGSRAGGGPSGPRVAGLLLAAGGGRRLGGRPKALLPHHGRPLAEHAAAALREGGCDPLYVVLGAAADAVRARVRIPGAVLLDNPGWAEGMGSSLRVGLRALPPGTEAVLISLVDQPGIGAETVARVRAAAAAGPDSLVAAAYSGRRGHPVLFGAAHWRGIAESATGDRGARDYLRAHAPELTLVECADLADPHDIDTPEDLNRLSP